MFKGVKSSDMGIQHEKMPTRASPAANGQWERAAGRSGRVWLDDESFDNVTVSIECFLPDVDRLADVLAWLTGEGLLIISDEPGMAYDARIVKSFKRSSITQRMYGQKFTVVFECQPFKRIYPAHAALTVSTSGTAVYNPGTAYSLPRVKIAGSGDFSVTIGEETLFFSGVSGGGIIVDSELMDAFTYDGALLANDHVSGTPYQIRPGSSVVSWIVESGAVSSVEILPRWRCI